MLIIDIKTGVTAHYREFFPSTSFPTDGPTDIWLDKNGFRRAQKTDKQLASEVRTARNELLAQSDWVVVAAYEKGGEVQAEWVTYRQALRDIPSQGGFPHNVEWPIKPGE